MTFAGCLYPRQFSNSYSPDSVIWPFSTGQMPMTQMERVSGRLLLLNHHLPGYGKSQPSAGRAVRAICKIVKNETQSQWEEGILYV